MTITTVARRVLPATETFAAYERMRPDTFFGDTIPGLAVSPMPYESIRTDVHSVARTVYAGDHETRHIDILCFCGTEVSVSYQRGAMSGWDAREEAFTLLVEHARTTCALCHGSKPADTFPRCSGCAF